MAITRESTAGFSLYTELQKDNRELRANVGAVTTTMLIVFRYVNLIQACALLGRLVHLTD